MTRILPDFGPARQNPAYRRLLVGTLLSALGSAMTSFAVVLQIWDLSRSSLAVGLLGLTFVPVLIVGLLGGSIADAVDRRKLALGTSAALMAVSAARRRRSACLMRHRVSAGCCPPRCRARPGGYRGKAAACWPGR